MQPWNDLTTAEQTLLRRAVYGAGLAGTVQHHGTDLRWAGSPDAPPRSLTRDEQLALVPRLAAVAADLAGRGLLTVHARQGRYAEPADPALTGDALHAALAEPDHWLWDPKRAHGHDLRAAEAADRHWRADVYPVGSADGLPDWDELSLDQQRVLVCADESSGMLTGPFGIWEDLPTELTGADRTAWVERQLAPLVPFVRDGWIEVQHHAAERGDAFTVVPLDRLADAFADPALRHDDGDDWGVGLTCTFTYRGIAVWRAGWSSAWGRRLRFEQPSD
ncbi:hypothetical protein AB0K51_25420 [Kitasatospora sp. NPDC049285]|uniref:hypothetical protein n=1 Tax=Kitasatospora sp. NPDC049285 TaxID=3157096 RepID=UPI003445284F